MRHSLITSLTILFLVAFCSTASATSIVETFTFESPQVKTVKVGSEMFDAVEMDGCPVSGNPGQPALPTKRARILLPYGHTLSDVEVVVGQMLPVGTGLRLLPIEYPFELSTPPDQIPPLTIDEVAYARREPLPTIIYEIRSTQLFRGYQIVFIDIIPVRYTPVSGDLYYYPEIKLIVTTEESVPTATIRGLTADAKAVAARVDNSSELHSYPPAGLRAAGAYDLLIISPTFLADAYQPLMDYHNAHGTTTEIHTLDQIGANDPHTVRDYIRNEYLSNGISMVLIGGDDNLIPALDMFIELQLSSGYLTVYDMPGDIYFGNLDGTYNYDGDSYWGEPTDGEGGGDIDLLPEVGVGRISAETTEEAGNMVTKSIAYLESEGAYLSKVVLVGEQLGFGGLAGC